MPPDAEAQEPGRPHWLLLDAYLVGSWSRISTVALGPKLDFLLAIEGRPLATNHVLDHEPVVFEDVNKRTRGERGVD